MAEPDELVFTWDKYGVLHTQPHPNIYAEIEAAEEEGKMVVRWHTLPMKPPATMTTNYFKTQGECIAFVLGQLLATREKLDDSSPKKRERQVNNTPTPDVIGLAV